MSKLDIDIEILKVVPLNNGRDYRSPEGYCAVSAMAGACGVDVENAKTTEWRMNIPKKLEESLSDLERRLSRQLESKETIRLKLIRLAEVWQGHKYKPKGRRLI